jgi:uncharacterized protein (DUF305 family)
MRKSGVVAAIILSVAASGAMAQSADQGSAMSLPKACQTAAQAGSHGQMMDKMNADMSHSMQTGMQGMGQMTETQKGLQQAMMKMSPAMMLGMMAKDADVAWICAMIPHHQGAIDMARAGLKGADNAESKRMAEEAIKMQEKEIATLVAWVEKNADRESRNETTGANSKQQ